MNSSKPELECTNDQQQLWNSLWVFRNMDLRSKFLCSVLAPQLVMIIRKSYLIFECKLYLGMRVFGETLLHFFILLFPYWLMNTFWKLSLSQYIVSSTNPMQLLLKLSILSHEPWMAKWREKKQTRNKANQIQHWKIEFCVQVWSPQDKKRH